MTGGLVEKFAQFSPLHLAWVGVWNLGMLLVYNRNVWCKLNIISANENVKLFFKINKKKICQEIL